MDHLHRCRGTPVALYLKEVGEGAADVKLRQLAVGAQAAMAVAAGQEQSLRQVGWKIYIASAQGSLACAGSVTTAASAA